MVVVVVHGDCSTTSISLNLSYLVIIYGIKENPSGTPRSAHTKSDIDSCVHVLKQANDNITEQSIRDCLRKFG